MKHLGFALLALAAAGSPAAARDWIHWRGPEQNGVSRETNLPGSFDPKLGAKGNVVWRQPFGGRSAPLVMAGKLYIIQGVGEGLHEGEQVVCFDEKTGAKQWAFRVNVFHTDIVSSRLGWTTLTADPATKTVYAHTTAGLVLALDPDGKLLWQRSLTEEFGRISGYGGRIVTPVFDSGLCVVGMVNSAWGDMAKGSNRFVALDGKSGEVAWWGDTPGAIKGTYYSSPVVAVIGGQRLLISGGADGALHAFKIRTGERVWSYRFGAGVINGSPVVDGNLVYCNHGEENPEGGAIGRVICVDASQLDAKTKAPKLVWEFKRSNRFGLASGALAGGKLYLPDDSGELFCFNAKTGKVDWKYRYASEVRGAPLVADDKLYLFDVKGRLLIVPNKNGEEPNPDDVFEYKFRDPKGLLNETNGTAIAVNNRIYFTTRTDLFCLGVPDAKDACGKYKEFAAETPADPAGKAVGLRLFPADVTLNAGGKVVFSATPVDANGRAVKAAGTVELSLPLPAKTPTGAQPPALKGKADGLTVTVEPVSSQQGYVEAKLGDLVGKARVRVAATTMYKQDFDKVPEGAVPGGWVNTQAKFAVKKLPDGTIVLSKVNTDSRPPFARANAYITGPNAANYTITSDVYATEVRGRMPDIGVVNSRYTLILDGKPDDEKKSRQLRLVSWEARPRVNLATNFDWQPGTWYTMKMSAEPQPGGKVTVRGKVWKRGETEPTAWQFEFADPAGNATGAAALYGYVSDPQITAERPGADIFYDNVTVTPNGK
ncbi:PQQ-binding-like beta-propeller repeat protein [Urbifossiella limnaea]|uniref:Outer membrane biogenesis protein BamB n=1 Tax=Urbifossiella limnaea TaxID=2528023 RepID=A0A517XR81_9BACT|nr:PQQ-binding-like beta-propeller repeat protein [Urbifossiella limnaea]QDU20011.1 outer membrane biogenesis protein BamB [Urbifossiella limnaea]